MANTSEATCLDCQKTFWYVPSPGGKVRRVCDACQRRRRRGSTTRWKQQLHNQAEEERFTGELADQFGVRPIAEVSRMMGIADARPYERSALMKLRRHPELRQLFLEYLAAGGGMPSGPLVDADELLFEGTRALGRWAQVRELLLAEGLTAEAAEVLQETNRFRTRFQKLLPTIANSHAD